jgi:hypothetical protein
MYCGKCGEWVEDGNEFCTACGERLVAATGQNRAQQPDGDANSRVPGTVAVPSPVISTEHPGVENKPLVKPGKVRLFGILLIIFAVLSVLIAPIFCLAPAALLLTGIFGIQLVRRYGRLDLLGERTSGLATADCIAGILLILSAVAYGIYSIFFINYGDAILLVTFALITMFSLLQVILLGSLVVLYFKSAQLAKRVKELSSVTFSLSAIILGICLLCILAANILPWLLSLGWLFAVLYGVVTTLEALLLTVFFIMRGVFWIRVAGRFPRPTNPSAIGMLTGGAKFGYFALGFFVGVIGILISWLVNKDNPSVSRIAIKFSVIGLASTVVLAIVTVLILFLVVSFL